MKLLNQGDVEYLFHNHPKKGPLFSLLHYPAMRLLAKRIGESRIGFVFRFSKSDDQTLNRECDEILKLFAKQPRHRFSIAKDMQIAPELQDILKKWWVWWISSRLDEYWNLASYTALHQQIQKILKGIHVDAESRSQLALEEYKSEAKLSMEMAMSEEDQFSVFSFWLVELAVIWHSNYRDTELGNQAACVEFLSHLLATISATSDVAIHGLWPSPRRVPESLRSKAQAAKLSARKVDVNALAKTIGGEYFKERRLPSRKAHTSVVIRRPSPRAEYAIGSGPVIGGDLAGVAKDSGGGGDGVFGAWSVSTSRAGKGTSAGSGTSRGNFSRGLIASGSFDRVDSSAGDPRFNGLSTRGTLGSADFAFDFPDDSPANKKKITAELIERLVSKLSVAAVAPPTEIPMKSPVRPGRIFRAVGVEPTSSGLTPSFLTSSVPVNASRAVRQITLSVVPDQILSQPSPHPPPQPPPTHERSPATRERIRKIVGGEVSGMRLVGTPKADKNLIKLGFLPPGGTKTEHGLDARVEAWESVGFSPPVEAVGVTAIDTLEMQEIDMRNQFPHRHPLFRLSHWMTHSVGVSAKPSSSPHRHRWGD